MKDTFIQAVNYMYAHIDQPLTLETIATACHISTTTLKRLFIDHVDMGPARFLRKLRMETAFCTLKTKEQSVLNIALANGFSDHAAFSRTFKTTFGITPSQAKQTINIMQEMEMVKLIEPDFIEIDEMIAYGFTEQGLYYDSAPRAWEKLNNALEKMAIDNHLGLYIGIGHDNPHDGEIAADHVKYTAAITHISKPIATAQTVIIRQGLYARFRYQGKPSNLGQAYHYIYGAWATKTNKQIDAKHPAIQIFSDLPNGYQNCEIYIYVPIQN